MTINTQAFLQGYLHEKTAGWRGRRVTPIVAAPGIPQTAPDPGVKTLFPDGKARFKRTQLKMPPTVLDDQGRGEYVTPASVNDQLLGNVPGGAAALVAEQKDNYETQNMLGETLGFSRPWHKLISFDDRNQPVLLDTRYKSDGEITTYFKQRRIAGFDPEELRKRPKGNTYPLPEGWGEYHGLPENSAMRRDMAMLGHELTHNYTGGDASVDHRWPGIDPSSVGTSYITDKGLEYTQGVTAGLNAMRDVTGEYLNTPQQVHQLFDEIIAKPSILDSINNEHARIFRTYLTLRKTNPELAEKLRDSMARDSQYLVKNEPAGDPMVQTV